MSSLEVEENKKNRTKLLEKLKAEIIGPDPAGEPIDIHSISLWEKKDFYKPKKQTNEEEILQRDPPLSRYGAGILYPQDFMEKDHLEEMIKPDEEDSEIYTAELSKKDTKHIERMQPTMDEEDEEEGVTLSNSHRPSAMGLSFLVDLSEKDNNLLVFPSFAIYNEHEIDVKGKTTKQILWLRKPYPRKEEEKITIKVSPKELLFDRKPIRKSIPGFKDKLDLVVVSRPIKKKKQSLITVSLINKQSRNREENPNTLSFFQCRFTIKTEGKTPSILPYNNSKKRREETPEEKMISLLYRGKHNFAVGHGCAAGWNREEVKNQKISEIWTDTMPVFETPSTDPEIRDEKGDIISIRMKKLSGIEEKDKGRQEIEKFISAYEKWIQTLDREISSNSITPRIPENLHETAKEVLKDNNRCLDRIKKGVEFLWNDSPISQKARKAFELMNHAMLHTRLRGNNITRTPIEKGIYDFPIEKPDPMKENGEISWRPFQIGFILMTLQGICVEDHEERDITDLLWFPTGGGKTEAYLGLTAFTIFFNRIIKNKSTGIDVLMRYTLRLLTSQQFERAATLFCAMEFLRRGNTKTLGIDSFNLGLWVGGSISPNKRKDAIKKLQDLQNAANENKEGKNPFVILKCPWCNAKFGLIEGNEKKKNKSSVDGYKNLPTKSKGKKAVKSVYFACPDRKCDFHESSISKERTRLPIVVIDEDIYETPPNLLIATVDKFALLPWFPEARSIFGIQKDGDRSGIPPTLIIQDELHLISGPLGSMVGAFEPLIELLCSDLENENQKKPKIIASTATIRNASEQILALYGREKTNLFPPSGLEAGNSFFSRETMGKGRIYTGIMAPGHGSLQTSQARVYASLLQFPKSLDEGNRDPWWTLLSFFNSTRELGGACSLIFSDVKEYLNVIGERHAIPEKQRREIRADNILELKGGMSGDQIPLAIKRLEQKLEEGHGKIYSETTPDVCLSTNIIEVGVDINRLSLMTIVGQPKTTSQYIQVSSRIGRNQDAPGLVIVLLSPSKPRDRSHYERFGTFHESLYAQVEPTSVTPYSPPATDRTLHSILVGAVRQLAPLEQAKDPRKFSWEQHSKLWEIINRMMKDRVSTVDPEETERVQKRLEFLKKRWTTHDPKEYGNFGKQPEDSPLIYPVGQEEPSWDGFGWATASSLRSVDTESRTTITQGYRNVHE